ncbi:hypothetical protein QFZ24_003630 [Streptomyces phaeochromogenes]|nr:hypothetical protein [Streptomyces phaeochromogenes]
MELVGRAQPGVLTGPGRGADERDAALARVQMVDPDAAEGPGLLAGLAQFLDQLPPDGHRGAGVHQELDVAAPAAARAADGHQDSAGGRVVGGRLLVDRPVPGRGGGSPVAAQGAQRLFETQQARQRGGRRGAHREDLPGAVGLRTGTAAGRVQGDGAERGVRAGFPAGPGGVVRR